MHNDYVISVSLAKWHPFYKLLWQGQLKLFQNQGLPVGMDTKTTLQHIDLDGEL